MKDLLLLLAHLLATLAKFLEPGGAKAIVADSLLMKQQLLIVNRSRRRAPNLTPIDRILLGFLSLFLSDHHIERAAVILRPATLLNFHDNDPLFQYHQWQANLSILDVDEAKSMPYTPRSHPFVERLIGTIRREFLDQTLLR